MKTVSFEKKSKAAVPPKTGKEYASDREDTAKDISKNDAEKIASPSQTKPKAVASGGNVTNVVSANLMHEEDDDVHEPYGMGLHDYDIKEDPKRKFLYARQLTHFFEDNPPLPLLPKSVVRQNESPRTGGQNFLKLTRFRGQDFGKSKFRDKEQEVERIQFPKEVTTLK